MDDSRVLCFERWFCEVGMAVFWHVVLGGDEVGEGGLVRHMLEAYATVCKLEAYATTQCFLLLAIVAGLAGIRWGGRRTPFEDRL